MIDSIEQLVRDAGDQPVAPLDVTRVRDRARRRQRQRRTRRGFALLLSVALAATAVALATSGSGGTSRRVDTAGTLPTFTRTPGIPGAESISGIASNGSASVATGTVPDPRSTRITPLSDAAIWASTNTQSWRLVYSEPPVLTARPPNGIQSSSDFRSVLASAHGFVVWGSTGRPGLNGPVAAVWTSPDGSDWRPADAAQFLPAVSVPADHGGGPVSAIYGLTLRNGMLVGIGEIYTHSKQPDGGQPCIWLSNDGTRWEHRVIDLGPGFDPNVGSITVRGDLTFISGHVDRDANLVWSSHDLVRWHRTALAARGGAGVFDTPYGLVAAGTVPLSSRRNDARSQPAIWHSSNGRQWRRVLSLPPGRLAGFGEVIAADGRLFAIGSRGEEPRATNTLVYTSTDGRHWRDADPGHDVFTKLTRVTAVTNVGTDVLIAGTIQDNVPYGSVTPYFWRATG